MNSNFVYPVETRVIRVLQYENQNLSNTDLQENFIIIDNEPLRQLNDDEVLIKIVASPLSQYDALCIKGMTNEKVPFTPGREGSGIIISVSNNNCKQDLQNNSNEKNIFHEGQKVIFKFSFNGFMREHIILKKKDLILLSDNIDLIEASILQINPLTAYGLVEQIKKHNAKSIILDSANSCVSRIIYKLCIHNGIKVINIVRSEERVKELKAEGCKYVLNQNDETMAKELKELALTLDATIAIDSLAGDIVGLIVKALPQGGVLINYGSQTKLPMSGIDASEFRWGEKEIKSFVMPLWLNKISKEEHYKIVNFIIENKNDIFSQEISKVDSIWNYKNAYMEFTDKKKSFKRFVLTCDIEI